MEAWFLVSMSVKTYECESCGAVFNGTAEEAFQAGWDTPERFLSHTTCGTCPISATAWWKAVVLKEPLTEEEAQRVILANKIHDENPQTPPEYHPENRDKE